MVVLLRMLGLSTSYKTPSDLEGTFLDRHTYAVASQGGGADALMCIQ